MDKAFNPGKFGIHLKFATFQLFSFSFLQNTTAREFAKILKARERDEKER